MLLQNKYNGKKIILVGFLKNTKTPNVLVGFPKITKTVFVIIFESSYFTRTLPLFTKVNVFLFLFLQR